jgi:AcrR family transcriptional regulator
MTGVGIRERKKQATRGRIIAEAVRLFSARGIAAVTVDEIAVVAEVGKGTVYNYFAAKEDIIVSFLLDLDRAALTAMPALADEASSPAEALDKAAWSMLANKEAHRPFVRAFLGRLVSGESFAHELGAFQQVLDRALTAFFERLIARFGLAPERSIAELSLSFKTQHLGLSTLWSLEGPPFTTTRMLTAWHMDLFAKGLRP